ncbi:MAG: cobalt-precorrin-5B (C(1))-methyltransferase CbiD [Nitrososphaerota archaeon]|jgi:cobalt-precorrin-5B (C1)-methyltransferase|nr:cobalt-precorrin-5B (C(1))-methyltransferase CbiD [Nitrososphaerota archaeon]
MARFLKYGITTGATAAAAAKAAVITALKEPVNCVVIPTPIGLRFEIPVKSSRKLSENTAEAVVVKDAGQDIDATDKMEIIATVKITNNATTKIVIKNGVGIGVVTKPGLQIPIGEGAINPVPRVMITEAVKEVLPEDKGAEIIISAPEGANIAKKTTNAKLGVKGGVSILGTTGVVKPLSLEACRRSLVPQIDVAIARGYKKIVFVPGNIGEKIAKENFKVPEDAIVQTGDFVGYMLDKAVEKDVKEIIFIGHSGKMVKLAANIFNTHHKTGDARNEVIAAYAGAVGASTQIINQLLVANTSDEASEILRLTNILEKTYNSIATRVNQRVSDRVDNKIKISIVIVAMDGKILGMDKTAKEHTPWLNLT